MGIIGGTGLKHKGVLEQCPLIRPYSQPSSPPHLACAVLPVNYTAHGVNQTIDNLTSAFLSMTLSNIPRESGLLW